MCPSTFTPYGAWGTSSPPDFFSSGWQPHSSTAVFSSTKALFLVLGWFQSFLAGLPRGGPKRTPVRFLVGDRVEEGIKARRLQTDPPQPILRRLLKKHRSQHPIEQP